jgi:hypothetical protein
VGALLVFAFHAAVAWRLRREVRLAAYDRYSNLADPVTIRRIVDKNHRAVFDRSFISGARQTAETFEPSVYNNVMDSLITLGLAEEKATTGPPPTAPPPAVAPTAVASTPLPASASAQRPPHPLRITAMALGPAPADSTEFVLPGSFRYLLTLDVEDAVDDLFGEGGAPVDLVLACPSMEEHRASLPSQEARGEKHGSGVRYSFRVTFPGQTVRASQGVCGLRVTLRDQANQTATLESFVALR